MTHFFVLRLLCTLLSGIIYRNSRIIIPEHLPVYEIKIGPSRH